MTGLARTFRCWTARQSNGTLEDVPAHRGREENPMISARTIKVAATLLLCISSMLLALIVAEVSAQTGDWSPSEAISNTTGSSYSPHMAVDSQDTVHLVWYDWVDLVPHWPYVVYASKAAGGNWTPYSYLPGKPEGDSPALAVDGGDAVHVVWAGRERIEYARRSADGTWGAVEEIPASDEGLTPDVAVAPDSTVHAVWRRFAGPDDERVYHSTKTSGAGWSAPSQVYGGSNASSPMIAADADSTVHLLINTSSANVHAFSSCSTSCNDGPRSACSCGARSASSKRLSNASKK